MLTRLIFDFADQTPDRPALIYNREPWSYRTFARSIAMARGYFSRRGYSGQGYAVLALNNVRAQWVQSLALRSLGLTTVAVPSVEDIRNFRLPGVRCVIVDPNEPWAGLESLCREMGVPLLAVNLPSEQPLDLEERGSEPPQGGNVLRTSGTTGTYKLVLMTPAIEAEVLRRKQMIIGMNRDSLMSVSNFPLWSGAGYKWAASAWLAGGAVLSNTRRGEHLALAHPGLTHAATVPRNVAAILAAPADAVQRNDRLHLIVTAGTATRAQIDQVKARITPHVYSCLIGTEFSIAAYTRLDTPEDHRWHRVARGRVIEIVDNADKPVPFRNLGRVRVNIAGGPSGYLGDEDLTRAFFKDGFFYPGDLGVMREDGRIALQGRLTDIINVGGRKIFPAPIEDHLREAFGIDGACLLSMQNDFGEEELHVVLETSTPIPIAPVLAEVGNMIERIVSDDANAREAFASASVHFSHTLPRNHMGKLMRRAVLVQLIAAKRNRERAGSEPGRSSPA